MFHDHFGLFSPHFKVVITQGFVAAERSLWNRTWSCSQLSRNRLCYGLCKPAGKAGVQTWCSAPPIFHWGHLFSSLWVLYGTLQPVRLIMWPLELDPHWLITTLLRGTSKLLVTPGSIGTNLVNMCCFQVDLICWNAVAPSKLRESTGILFLSFLSPLLSVHLLFLGSFCSSRISWLLQLTSLSTFSQFIPVNVSFFFAL